MCNCYAPNKNAATVHSRYYDDGYIRYDTSFNTLPIYASSEKLSYIDSPAITIPLQSPSHIVITRVYYINSHDVFPRPLQPAGGVSGDQVQLVGGRDVWVPADDLAAILNLTETRGGDDSAVFLLRRVVMLVFSVEELAYSRGQGIMSASSLDTPHRRPLDPDKVAACKGW